MVDFFEGEINYEEVVRIGGHAFKFKSFLLYALIFVHLETCRKYFPAHMSYYRSKMEMMHRGILIESGADPKNEEFQSALLEKVNEFIGMHLSIKIP